MPVFSFRTVTFAPAIAAPELSITCPRILPRSFCAAIGRDIRKKNSNPNQIAVSRMTFFSFGWRARTACSTQ